MQLEVVESGRCAEEPVAMAASGCTDFMIGCCIIHFWCWEPGQGLCC
ncbi:MAG: hypothetical protein HXS51_04370 [Theionarchaea archaeon]|nr:hypothetical protein [Theionarchaea archaeon]